MEKHILVKGMLLLLWIWLCSEALSLVAAKHNGEASKMEMGLGVVPRVWKEKRGMKREHLRPCKNMVLYFHDILYNGQNAHNATSAIVAAPQGANLTALSSSNNHFGDMVVFDDPITLNNNLHSPPVGRAQGFYFYDMKNTFSSWLGFTFVLNHTDFYKGTLTFGGADPILTKYRDISVVGGTGDFVMARGIATLSTDSFEGDVYFRLRVNITLYECY